MMMNKRNYHYHHLKDNGPRKKMIIIIFSHPKKKKIFLFHFSYFSWLQISVPDLFPFYIQEKKFGILLRAILIEKKESQLFQDSIIEFFLLAHTCRYKNVYDGIFFVVVVVVVDIEDLEVENDYFPLCLDLRLRCK